ncbi:DUF362 domain-containing protein [Candidatus Thorarchaeota archaeon]|nr:MAG: DUF362 domain-containing protein [Candidatus Thorarchaeota archaeon]
MTALKVFFTDRQARSDYNMLDKLEHVFRELELMKEIKTGDKVMIKTHFGLYGNTNHIRPAYVRKLVDLVKEAGGFPFVADTCSLAYGSEGPYGGRTTQPEYLMRAAMNGFTAGALDAPIVIIDGYWGVDTYHVQIEGEHIQSVPVAAATLNCDKVILLTHAKFHHIGIAGSLKNMGVGMVGKQGKAAVHCPGGLEIYPEKCLGVECSKCVSVCPVRCIEVTDTLSLDTKKCVTCGHCSSVCSTVNAGALKMTWTGKDMAERIVENTLGVTKSIGSDKFYYINLAIDISDMCDCIRVGAPLLMHDLGIFGSTDPVAVDHATLQAMKTATLNHASPKHDDFDRLVESSQSFFRHGEKLGLGSTEYKLVTLTKTKP